MLMTGMSAAARCTFRRAADQSRKHMNNGDPLMTARTAVPVMMHDPAAAVFGTYRRKRAWCLTDGTAYVIVVVVCYSGISPLLPTSLDVADDVHWASLGHDRSPCSRREHERSLSHRRLGVNTDDLVNMGPSQDNSQYFLRSGACTASPDHLNMQLRASAERLGLAANRATD